jgi:hypothetical protein
MTPAPHEDREDGEDAPPAAIIGPSELGFAIYEENRWGAAAPLESPFKPRRAA